MTAPKSEQPSSRPRPRLPYISLFGLPPKFEAVLFGVLCLGVGLALLTSAPVGFKVLGALLTVAGPVISVVATVRYLGRPIGDQDLFDPDLDTIRETGDDWAHRLTLEGEVSIDLSRARLAWFWPLLVILLVLFPVGAVFFWSLGGLFGFMMSALCAVGFPTGIVMGVIPHLESATARGPALRIDKRGIQVARWGGLQIPWRHVRLAAAPHVGSVARNVVIVVDGSFYDEYQSHRPWLLRLIDRWMMKYSSVAARQHGSFTVPFTLAASPVALADWLTQEAEHRHPHRRGLF